MIICVLGEPRRRDLEAYRREDCASLLDRSEEHTSELQSQSNLVCRLLLEKKKISGYFKTVCIYDLKPAGNTDAFVPSSIPMPTVVRVNNTTVSIRHTRLRLNFRTPTTNIGHVHFYVEGDLFGTNATTPRLRHAYAQARNVLIGQTFSNFMDPNFFFFKLHSHPPNLPFSPPNPPPD